MFPAEALGVGVTVAALRPAPWVEALPAGVVSSRPSRIGDLIPVGNSRDSLGRLSG